MPPTKSAEIFVAKHGFATTYKDQKVIVYPGDTVEDGHWLLTNSPDAFEPLEVKYPNLKGQPAPPPPAAPSAVAANQATTPAPPTA